MSDSEHNSTMRSEFNQAVLLRGASLLWRMSKSSTYQQNNATFDTDAPLKFFRYATKTFWV